MTNTLALSQIKARPNRSTSWGTETENAFFEHTNTQVYPRGKKKEIVSVPHEVKRRRTDAANLRRMQLIAESSALKQDWLDAGYWRLLGRLRGFRFAYYYQPLSTRGIRRTLCKLAVTSQKFTEYFGEVSYEQYVNLNPRLPLWVFQGLLLENMGKPCENPVASILR